MARVTPNKRIQDDVVTEQQRKILYYELNAFGLFYGLTASNPVQLNFLKIRDCCGGFECKIERVTKLSFVDDFKEWSFGQFGGLLEFQHFESRPIAYIYERMSIMDVLI